MTPGDRRPTVADLMFVVAWAAVACWAATWLPRLVVFALVGPTAGDGLFLPPGSR